MYTASDILQLAATIRHFVMIGDLGYRLEGEPSIRFEFKDVGAMHGMRLALEQAFADAVYPRSSFLPIDDETVEAQIGGVRFVLTCNQRVRTESGKAAGYSNMRFVDVGYRGGMPKAGRAE
jgi:hypothetical protein